MARLEELGRQRAQETGRTAPNEADMDWALAQMKPGEEGEFGNVAAFDAFERGMRGAAQGAGKGESMAKKTGPRAKRPGVIRRAASRVAGAVGGVARAVVGRKKAKGRSTAASSPVAPRARRARGAGKRPAKRRAPAQLPVTATPAGMMLYEAREISPGVFEAMPPSKAPKRRKRGGGLARANGGGGIIPRRGSMPTWEYLTLAGTGLAGMPLGYWLQNQPQVPIPFTSATVGRGTLTWIASLLTALVTRKWKPRIARHAATLTVGVVGGVALQKRAAKNAEGSTTA